jgi:predicted homoserine dehydrogenase-like protein
LNLFSRLQERAQAGRPVRVALIGAGKFGSMFLAQVPTIPGLEVTAIADLDPDRARLACRNVGWDEERTRRTRFVASGTEAVGLDGVEVVIARRPGHRKPVSGTLSRHLPRSGTS